MPVKKAAESDSARTTFSKEQILTFKRFAARRDLLKVTLDDGQRYTLNQVETVIKDFMTPKGKVM